MSDLVITAANVLQGGDATVDHGIAGVAITAGQAVYKDGSTGTYKLAKNNLAGAFPATGIALNGAAAGQPVDVQQSGGITIGATLVAGDPYYLSGANAGGICPKADLTTGEAVVLLGLAKSTTVLGLKITIPGVTL